MLKTLSNIEPTKAQLVLSEITRSFVPTPYEAADEPHSDLYRSVLSEILSTLGLNEESISTKDSQKVLSLLVREMKSMAFDEEKWDNIKERLGEKGELALSQYQIKFGDDAQRFEPRGIIRSEITKTIKTPDDFIHMLRTQETNEDQALVSIYVKKIGPRQEDMFLLVETKRDGSTQLVSTAWKVFLKDIGTPKNNDALSLLRKFVDVYGVELSIGNASNKKKFFLYEAFPLLKEDAAVWKVHNREGESFELSCLMRLSSLGVMEVSMAYAINTDKYLEDLRRHGVKVKKKKTTRSS